MSTNNSNSFNSQSILYVGSAAVLGGIVYYQLSSKITALEEKIKELKDTEKQNPFSTENINKEYKTTMKAIFTKLQEQDSRIHTLEQSNASLLKYVNELTQDQGDQQPRKNEESKRTSKHIEKKYRKPKNEEEDNEEEEEDVQKHKEKSSYRRSTSRDDDELVNTRERSELPTGRERSEHVNTREPERRELKPTEVSSTKQEANEKKDNGCKVDESDKTTPL
jgi:hypothetical protein